MLEVVFLVRYCVVDLVNGEWGVWLAWSTCSQSCKVGSKIRSRLCDNPPPTNNGSECFGISLESSDCNLGECPSKNDILVNLITVVGDLKANLYLHLKLI